MYITNRIRYSCEKQHYQLGNSTVENVVQYYIKVFS